VTLHARSGLSLGRDWKHMTEIILFRFFSILITIGLNNLPAPDHAWSSSSVFRNDFIQSLMSLTEFRQIFHFLHFNDNNEQQQSDDPLFKIRPLLDELSVQCKANWNLARELSIDEMDISFKGLHRFKVSISFYFFSFLFSFFFLSDYFSSWDRRESLTKGLVMVFLFMHCVILMVMFLLSILSLILNGKETIME
jgi:hypothetical protein